MSYSIQSDIKVVDSFAMTYLALGCGVQSSALLLLCCTDPTYPNLDCAIFADTGDEPQWVYDYLKILTDFAQAHGVPVYKVQTGVLSEAANAQEGDRFVNVPLHLKKPDGSRGILKRQCTNEYKIQPIERKVRELLGLRRHEKNTFSKVRALIGISIDEVARVKPARTSWVVAQHPLVDNHINREQCKQIVLDHGLPEPQKSACVFCPYHSNTYWLWLKTEHPTEFQRAVDFDRFARSRQGRYLDGYVHKSCTPLEYAHLGEDQMSLFHDGEGFTEECEGYCGV